MSMMMYQSCLQKEGITYLNHLGLSVSYDSMEKKLQEAQHIPAADVRAWKKTIVENEKVTKHNSLINNFPA